MTKAEQARRMAWRFKVLQQARAASETVAILALSAIVGAWIGAWAAGGVIAVTGQAPAADGQLDVLRPAGIKLGLVAGTLLGVLWTPLFLPRTFRDKYEVLGALAFLGVISSLLFAALFGVPGLLVGAVLHFLGLSIIDAASGALLFGAIGVLVSMMWSPYWLGAESDESSAYGDRLFLVAIVTSVVVVFHLWLALPALTDIVFVAMYVAVAIHWARTALDEATSRRWRRRYFAVLVTMPIAASLVIGYVRFSEAPVSSTPSSESSASIQALPTAPLFMHLSDTHFIGVARGKTFEGYPWDRSPIEQLATAVRRLRPRYLLITGDITDTGAASEWAQATTELLAPAAQAGTRVIMAPGNHDLQPAFGGARGAAAADIALLERFLITQEQLAPSVANAHVIERIVKWNPSDEEAISACIDREAATDWDRHLGFWRWFCSREGMKQDTRGSLVRARRRSACAESFPLDLHDDQSGVSLFILCSNVVTTWRFGDVGIGSLGSAQLAGLAGLLERIPPTTQHVLIMLHHPPVRRWDDDFRRPPPNWWRSFSAWEDSQLWRYAFLGTARNDSADLIRLVQKAADAQRERQFVILYGHAHESYLGTVYSRNGNLTLSEAPAAYGSPRGARLGYTRQSATGIDWRWLQLP